VKKIVHRLGPLLVMLLFCGAAWLLYHELKPYRLHDIRQALGAMPAWQSRRTLD
jgi:hypothetical protein